MNTEEKRCPKCGQILAENATACDFCLTNVEGVENNNPENCNATADVPKSKKGSFKTKLISVISTILVVVVTATLKFYFKKSLYGDKDKEQSRKKSYQYSAEVDIPTIDNDVVIKYGHAFGFTEDGVYTSAYRNMKFTPREGWYMYTSEELGEENDAIAEEGAEEEFYCNYQMIVDAYTDDGEYEGFVIISILASDDYSDTSEQEYAQYMYEDDETTIVQSDTVNIVGTDYFHACAVSEEDGCTYDAYIFKDDDLFYEICICSEPGYENLRDEVLACFEEYK